MKSTYDFSFSFNTNNKGVVSNTVMCTGLNSPHSNFRVELLTSMKLLATDIGIKERIKSIICNFCQASLNKMICHRGKKME